MIKLKEGWEPLLVETCCQRSEFCTVENPDPSIDYFPSRCQGCLVYEMIFNSNDAILEVLQIILKL